MTRSKLTLVALLSMFLMAGLSTVGAQEPPQPPGPPRDGERREGDRRRPDPAEMRQRFMDRLKETLGASDDEWKVLQPKLEQLMNASREMRSGGSMFGRSRGGSDREPETATGKASQELRKLLDNKDARPGEIQEKLSALRAAREKAKANVATAQKELKELLTQRQEATLVMYGMLE